MKYEPEIVVDTDGDAFADATQCADGFAFSAGERRVRGAEQEGAGETDLSECLPEDARFKGGDVGGDVGEFRHGLKNEVGQGIVQEAERKRNSATADSVRGFPMEVL